MISYTPFEYLLIDTANNFGLDKELFESRIQWATYELNGLEALMQEADDPIPFIKSVMAVRDAQKGVPSGHLVGFDACASGIQLMAVMTGCEVSAYNSGLINPNWRADAYTVLTKKMDTFTTTPLKDEGITRDEVKQAGMTYFYGSKNKPKEIFGEDSPAYLAFYKSLELCFPGAVDMMAMMINSWQPYALKHTFTMPDGFHVQCKVMDKTDMKVEVDELGGATFTHRFIENMGKEKGLELAAHICHALDGFLVREIGRRCNYDRETLVEALSMARAVLLDRSDYGLKPEEFTSLVWVEDVANFVDMPTYRLQALVKLITNCLENKSFPVLFNHDEYRCHANNVTRMRQVWIDIMAELADANIAQDILNEIGGTNYKFTKNSNNLSSKIRGGAYGIC